jgi:acetyl esterase/lipase
MVFALAISAAYADGEAENILDVVYGHKDGMALTYDVFKPNQENNNGTGLLFMVSGGWFSKWYPPVQTRAFLKAYLDAGFTLIAIRHGSSPKYKVPEAVKDVQRAVRHVRLHAKEFGIDPDKLGVFGGSAGGHLSLMIGAASDEGDPDAKDEVLKASNRVAAVVAFFPPTDLRLMAGPSDDFPALDFDKSLSESVSPILFATPDDPPTLFIHGDADELVLLRSSERMHAELEKQKVETELIVIEGAAHGFRGEDNKRAAQATVDWFEEHLLDK